MSHYTLGIDTSNYATVSYTHLDVYKRQPRHHTLLVQLIDCRHAPSADDLQMLKYLHYHQIPVSYTHLDVYKRQRWAWRTVSTC